MRSDREPGSTDNTLFAVSDRPPASCDPKHSADIAARLPGANFADPTKLARKVRLPRPESDARKEIAGET